MGERNPFTMTGFTYGSEEEIAMRKAGMQEEQHLAIKT